MKEIFAQVDVRGLKKLDRDGVKKYLKSLVGN
jgi:hypothetical protein